jgi:ribosomal protein S18 acetylase RimI-like enzyme
MGKMEIRPTTDIDLELLKYSKTPLPLLLMTMREALTLAGLIDGKTIAVSIAEKNGESYEVVYIAVHPDYQKKGYGRELLLHTLDYIRFLGGEIAETGAGNANVQMFTFLQRVGFRVSGVEQDHYLFGNSRPEVENAIVNLDQIRYRADLVAMARNR